MSEIKNDRKYTKEHEWAYLNSGLVEIGITDFAQSALGDIVFVELPEPGTTLEAEQAFGVVESIKSVSDLYCPLKGEVVEKNEELESSPEKCNEEPYGSWMIKLKVENAEAELDKLMDATAYQSFCDQQE